MSQAFKRALELKMKEIWSISEKRSCHVYYERDLRQRLANLKELAKTYKTHKFKEYFAVKAAPFPWILRIVLEYGFGLDCSSLVEFKLARQAGAKPEDIFFTSNNTTYDEFDLTINESITNLDDISFLDAPFFHEWGMPKTICFRINPGDTLTTENAQLSMSGKKAKYGIMVEQTIKAYKKAKSLGVENFGIHTMVCSNNRNYRDMIKTCEFLYELIEKLSHEGIEVSFMNMGGGIGIPYRPEDQPFNMESFFFELSQLQESFSKRIPHKVEVYMESGRWVAGPTGILLTRAINRKDIYETHIGVLDSMIGNPRPAIYGSYHDISVFDGKTFMEKTTEECGSEVVNVVGSICEDCDRLTIPGEPRALPKIHHSEEDGDYIVSADCGAHSVSMPSNYNCRPRLGAYAITMSDKIVMIHRPETEEDLLRRTAGL